MATLLKHPTVFRRFTGALLCVAVAMIIRDNFLDSLGGRVVWLTFYPAVMAAALYGGFCAGILATGASCLGAVYMWDVFSHQPFIKDSADWLGLAVFFVNGTMIAGMAEASRRALIRADTARQTAEDAEKELLQEKTLTEKLFNSSLDTILLFEAETGVPIRWNQRFTEISGYNKAEIARMKAPDDFYDPLDLATAQEAMMRITAEGHGCVELSLVTKQKMHIPFEYVVSVIQSETGETLFLSIGRDITDRKQAEMELLKTRDYLSNLLDYANAPIIVWDAEFKITRFNHAFEELTGRSAADVVGQGLDWLFPEEQRQASLAYIRSTSEARWETVEIAIQAGSGEERTLLWNSAMLYAADGVTVVATIAQGYDITDRNQAEMALREIQKQLLQQEKMASIGQLAAGVAHEINNPMGFITSNLGTLGKYMDKIHEYLESLEHCLDDVTGAAKHAASTLRTQLKIDYVLKDTRQLISESIDGAARVRNIVNNLKNLSRTDSQERVWADLNKILESSLNIVSNEIKYVADIDEQMGELPEILCHPQQLSQVFINLLTNAGHAIDGHGVITIRSWCENEHVCVSIADTGRGVPENIRNRIFEPFFTTKDVGKGTGLGLSISYDILKNHGGEIVLESETAGGSTFFVRLPVETAELIRDNRHGH